MDDFERELAEWENEDARAQDRPRYYAGQCRFPRFGRYELLTSGHYHWIVPAADAELEWYRPFEHEPRILRDYLDAAHALHRAETDRDRRVVDRMRIYLQGNSIGEIPDAVFEERINRDYPLIAAFCEKYGFLTCPSEDLLHGMYHRERLFLADGPAQLSMEPEEFKARFREDIRAAKGPFNEWVSKYFQGKLYALGNRDSQAAYFIRAALRASKKNPKPGSRGDHERHISEALDRSRRSALCGDDLFYWYGHRPGGGHMLRYVRFWHRFRTGGFQPTDPVPQDLQTYMQDYGNRWIDKLEGFYIRARMGLKYSDGQWKIDYGTEDLHDALGIMLMNSLTTGRQQIKLCALEECGRPFLSTDPRAHYCCTLHSQRGRIRKFREKHPARGVGKTEGEFSTKQGKTQGKSGKRVKR